MRIPPPACTPAARSSPVPRATSPAGAGRPMDRTGRMENAHETMAADWATVQARFPHRLGRHRTPPVRSTGKTVVLFEHDITGGISNTRCEADGRKLTDERRCAPTSRSRSPESAFTIPGFGVQLHRNAHQRSNGPSRLPHEMMRAREGYATRLTSLIHNFRLYLSSFLNDVSAHQLVMPPLAVAVEQNPYKTHPEREAGHTSQPIRARAS